MRAVAYLALLLLGLSPAVAQDEAGPAAPAAEKPAAKPKAKGKPTASEPEKITPVIRETYAAMPLAERLAIQSDLVWSGDYNGIINGDFGERAVAAVKAFQKRTKHKTTGILTADERTSLEASVKEKKDQVGWRLVDDPVLIGARLGIPGRLVSPAPSPRSGARWSSGRGEVQIETFRIGTQSVPFNAAFEQQKASGAERKVEYSVMRPDFFVVSGLQGLKKFYVRAHLKDEEIRGMTILYDQAMEGIMEPVVVAMSSAFDPFGAGGARKKVEYSSALAVSASGHLIASAAATEGCHVITIAGFGNAERIARDEDAGLALLRLNGAQIKPIALATAAPQGSDLTLVGIADPQAQGGGAAVTSANARLGQVQGKAVALSPLPAQGFSGAAALDRQGHVVGLVALQTAQAALVPTATIRKFLESEKVAPALGTTNAEEAKSALARVICVRK
jgi:peptidoglycan hydrolase-like protein with peptidoglycan-binding domain